MYYCIVSSIKYLGAHCLNNSYSVSLNGAKYNFRHITKFWIIIDIGKDSHHIWYVYALRFDNEIIFQLFHVQVIVLNIYVKTQHFFNRFVVRVSLFYK